MDLYSLIQFAKAWDGLGWAVQEQVEQLLADPDAARDMNPNAVTLIQDQLVPVLSDLDANLGAELAEYIDEWHKDACRAEPEGGWR